MLELFRKNTELYVKVLMNLRIPVKYQNKTFGKGERTELLLPEQVNVILTNNGNIKLWNGKKFVKLNLGQFYDIMQRKDYVVVDYIEPKVQVKPEVKKEEPKVQVKPEVKKEEPKEEVKPETKEEPKVQVQSEVKKEELKEEVKPENKNQQHQKNNNNKQRHNNNNKQGGDK